MAHPVVRGGQGSGLTRRAGWRALYRPPSATRQHPVLAVLRCWVRWTGNLRTLILGWLYASPQKVA